MRVFLITLALLISFPAAPARAWEQFLLRAPVTMEDVEHIINAQRVCLTRKTPNHGKYLVNLERKENKELLQALLQAIITCEEVTAVECTWEKYQQTYTIPHYEFSWDGIIAYPSYSSIKDLDISSFLVFFDSKKSGSHFSVFFPVGFKMYRLQSTSAVVEKLKGGVAGLDDDKWLPDYPVSMRDVERIVNNHNVCMRYKTEEGDWHTIDVTTAKGANILQSLLTSVTNTSGELRCALLLEEFRALERGWHYTVWFDPPIPWHSM